MNIDLNLLEINIHSDQCQCRPFDSISDIPDISSQCLVIFISLFPWTRSGRLSPDIWDYTRLFNSQRIHIQNAHNLHNNSTVSRKNIRHLLDRSATFISIYQCKFIDVSTAKINPILTNHCHLFHLSFHWLVIHWQWLIKSS